MGQQGLLSNEIATGRHTVFQRNRLHGDAVIFIDDGLLSGIHGMEYHLKAQIMSKEGNLIVQHGPQRLMSIDMERSCTT